MTNQCTGTRTAGHYSLTTETILLLRRVPYTHPLQWSPVLVPLGGYVAAKESNSTEIEVYNREY